MLAPCTASRPRAGNGDSLCPWAAVCGILTCPAKLPRPVTSPFSLAARSDRTRGMLALACCPAQSGLHVERTPPPSPRVPSVSERSE